jgi:hypothetical protein
MAIIWCPISTAHDFSAAPLGTSDLTCLQKVHMKYINQPNQIECSSIIV